MAFLYCLARLGVLGPHDAPAVGLRIFPHYLNLMRRVQTTYWCAAASQAAEASAAIGGLQGITAQGREQ